MDINKIHFGSIYKIKKSARNISTLAKYFISENDQRYGFFIPLFDGKNYYMIDTYMLNSEAFKGIYGKKSDELCKAIAEKLKMASNPEYGVFLRRMAGDYYYYNVFKLDDENVEFFEEVADMNNSTTISFNEQYDYNEEDVCTGLHMYNEHCYPDGFCIKKINAPIVWRTKISSFLNQKRDHMESPTPVSDYILNELEEMIKKAGDDYDKEEVRLFVLKNNFLKKQEKEYYAYCKFLEEHNNEEPDED